ncbi:glycosyltransferase [Engelhardtia mirabilis]|uniref:N-glycosyltransferase n=1 Tax=Engelhardtia mirabilis TaxID=2528011 RepID=A0A518BPR8_9BACT|nr:N-glycosyltransferase [Planctomycetes bacterium Pla133]QDV03283.1 N-glycosyltransferase [Planctomycetes bacterium Pla86]
MPSVDEAGPAAGGPRFGVIVPCRNEAAVIERKLSNLAWLEWPRGVAPRVLVVDDASSDATAELARSCAAKLAREGLAIEVIANRGPAGKASAVSTALEELAGSADLVLLTDADVVLREGAPAAFARAFDDGRVGMASGTQEFVRDLAADGRCVGADGAEALPAGDRYDRITALVRRIESRFGRVFSVHGQALCWRADLALLPPRGFVADDIDLMLQVRAAGRRVVLVDGARFLEPKVAAGDARESQVRRRAAGYFHLVRRTAHPLRGGLLDRLQWFAYRWLPGATPWLAALLSVALPALVWARWGGPSGSACALFVALLWLSPPGRGLRRLLADIARGSREERAGQVSDSWEMVRS